MFQNSAVGCPQVKRLPECGSHSLCLLGSPQTGQVSSSACGQLSDLKSCKGSGGPAWPGGGLGAGAQIPDPQVVAVVTS